MSARKSGATAASSGSPRKRTAAGSQPAAGTRTGNDTGTGTGTGTGTSDAPQSAASKLFDIRLLIGGLFTLYGIMLTIASFFTSDADKQKASNININLWLGIGMLIMGLLFLLWRQVSPLRVQDHAIQSGGTTGTEPSR